MKNTKQRQIILSIINNSNEHLDAYEIYERAKENIKNISLGTIYRNLNYLYNNNMINIISDKKDKMHYDKKEKHHHFICQRCQKIIDIYDLNIEIPKIIDNNTVTDYKITIEGICEKCQKED